MAGVVAAASQRGLTAECVRPRFAGEATRLAARFAHELLIGNTQVRVWGGESTVRLPPQPGRGGRNQHLALAASKLLVDYPDLSLLAAGHRRNGWPDRGGGRAGGRRHLLGNWPWPGSTSMTACRGPIPARRWPQWARWSSTGPTGTNVADLVIGLEAAPRRDVI